MALTGAVNLLYQAAERGDINALEALLANPEMRAQAAASNNAALRAACSNGHLTVVNRLLDIDAVREQAAAENNDALRGAAYNGHLDVVNRLLDIDAVREQATAMDNDALCRAAENGHLDVVNRLLDIDVVREQAAAINNGALRWAAYNGHLTVVNRLLDIDAVREQAAAENNAALHWAAANGHFAVVNRLLDIKAVREQAAAINNGAFYWAARNGHLDVVNRLLEIDAVREQAAAMNNNALRGAVANGHLAVVNRLLDIEAVRESELPAPIKKQLPLILAIKANQLREVRQYLDDCSVLSLYTALNRGNPYVIEALLNNDKALSLLREALQDTTLANLFNPYLPILQGLGNALRNNHTEEALSLLQTPAGKQDALAQDLYALRLAALKENHAVIQSILALDEVYEHPAVFIKLLEESPDKLTLEDLHQIASRFAPQIEALDRLFKEAFRCLNQQIPINDSPDVRLSSKPLEDDIQDGDVPVKQIESRGKKLNIIKGIAAHLENTLEEESLLLQLWTTLQMAIENKATSACTSSSSGPSYSSSSSSSSSAYQLSDDIQATYPAPSFLHSFAQMQVISSQAEASSNRLEEESIQDESLTPKKHRKQ